jgi:outer membrane protein assembly factor BamA
VDVRADTSLSDDGTQADVRFVVREGQQSLIDHIIVVGNDRTGTDTITGALRIYEGGPLGYTALLESRAALAALGLFRRVDIQPLQHAGEARRDVLVTVEEADPTILDLGAGIEGGFRGREGPDGQIEEQLFFAPRGFFTIGRRNLWGKNRAVTLFTRVSLRSTDVVVTEEGVGIERETDSDLGFNEYRVVATFSEPRVFSTPADVLITGITEQAVRTSFDFSRKIVRAESGRRLSQTYSVTGRYSFEKTRLFNRRFTERDPLIDRLFPQVRLSRFAGSLIRDTRDNALDPARGMWLTVDGDLAMRAIGSEVGFVRTFLQASTFRQLPTARRIVLGLAGRFGVARGFEREVDTGQTVADLPASERFFAGGDSSVRGFTLDRLGNAETINAETGFPTGGNGIVVVNSELRVSVTSRWQGVGFFDAGNVFLRAGALDLSDLRPAAGVGVRYFAPLIGMIRLDLGFNLDRRELLPGSPERGTVFHVSFGQAF